MFYHSSIEPQPSICLAIKNLLHPCRRNRQVWSSKISFNLQVRQVFSTRTGRNAKDAATHQVHRRVVQALYEVAQQVTTLPSLTTKICQWYKIHRLPRSNYPSQHQLQEHRRDDVLSPQDATGTGHIWWRRKSARNYSWNNSKTKTARPDLRPFSSLKKPGLFQGHPNIHSC